MVCVGLHMFPHVLDVRCIFDECFVVCSSFKDKEFLLAVHTPGRKFYMQVCVGVVV